jgi:hypothetical protein
MAAFTGQKELVRVLLGKGAKDPWLSKVPGFDPENVVPITPNKEKGDVEVGGLPFVLGSGLARRPWTLPPESERSETGYNLIRWAHPDREKGPLAAIVYADSRGNETLVSIVPAMYVGAKGILYHQNETSVAAGGPFAHVAILDKNLKIKRVVIQRQGGRLETIDKPVDARWQAGLFGMHDYEPITVSIYQADRDKPIVVDFDCVYRSASAGGVIYTVGPKR